MRFPSLLRSPDALPLISQRSNSLAFRLPQQGELFAANADGAGVTERVPWALNRQWLDLLSRSGTPLFVSIDPGSLGQEQKAGLSGALERAAVRNDPCEPVDWMDMTCPSRWRFGEECVEYDWFLDWR